MIELIPTEGLSQSSMRLGSVCRLQISRQRPEMEVRWFLDHNCIISTVPMVGWSTADQLALFPEAPGRYRLRVQWRVENQTGCQTIEFDVQPSDASFQPHRVEIPGRSSDTASRFWAPNANEAGGVASYESALLSRLDELVAEGDVIYDVGANIGLYAVPLARRVGEAGRVVCFEPNPVCVTYLQANIEANGMSHRCSILPVAVTDGAAEVAFTINFGNSLLGLSGSSAFFGSKAGQPITVSGGALAELVREHELPPPQVIKIDVEGAEHVVLPGMQEVLDRYRPLLLFEIHGLGVAREVIPMLEHFGYHYEDADSGRQFASGEELLQNYSEGVRQMICRPGPPS